MQVDLVGKVALVTGGAQGIGRATAIAMASCGANIAINDLSNEPPAVIEELRAMGVQADFFSADIGSEKQAERLISDAERQFGRIDILINNAGVNTLPPLRRRIDEYDSDEWHRVLSVDLHGVFYCSRAVSRRMTVRRSGAIVNISSTMGLVPSRLQSAYISAKAGVINLSRSMALELAQFGIRVNVIAPGSTVSVRTRAMFYSPENAPLAEALLRHIPAARPGTPEEIASAVLFLASPDASYITGAVLPVDGGWTAGYAAGLV